MNKSKIAQICIYTFLCPAAASGMEENFPWKTVSGWEITAQQDEELGIAGCFMGSVFEDGVYFAFSAFTGKGGHKATVVTLAKSSWKLPSSQLGQVDITLETGSRKKHYYGLARGNNTGQGMHIDIDFTPEFYSDIAYAKAIQITTPNKYYRYSLKGTMAAIGDFIDCFKTASAKIESQENDDDQPFTSDQPF